MDDKEAMRRAVAEADAARAKRSSVKESSEDGSFPSRLFSTMRAFAEGAVSSLSSRFSVSRRVIFLGAGGLLLLFILFAVLAASSSQGSLPAQYAVSGSVLCAYEDADSPSGYSYDAYVEITNTGKSSFYVTDPSFVIADETGASVLSDNEISMFPSVIAPGEKGYLFVFGHTLSGIQDASRELLLYPSYSVSSTDAAMHSYPVEQAVFSDGALHGQVMNDTDTLASSLYAVGFCYNSDGYCIGISGVFLDDLPAHGTAEISIPMTMIRAWRTEPVTRCDIRVF